jgi:hypothetical protein
VDAHHFTFRVSVSRDELFAETIRRLAVQAARYAGSDEAASEAFGHTVERAVREDVRGTSSQAPVDIVIRRDAGPVEVLVNGRALILEP